MFEHIISLIESYDTIILHRHTKPDGDAIGSQIGLKRLILDNYPTKRVLSVGDAPGRYAFVEGSTPDEVVDEVYTGALAIILDTAARPLISDERYTLAEKTARKISKGVRDPAEKERDQIHELARLLGIAVTQHHHGGVRADDIHRRHINQCQASRFALLLLQGVRLAVAEHQHGEEIHAKREDRQHARADQRSAALIQHARKDREKECRKVQRHGQHVILIKPYAMQKLPDRNERNQCDQRGEQILCRPIGCGKPEKRKNTSKRHKGGNNASSHNALLFFQTPPKRRLRL